MSNDIAARLEPDHLAPAPELGEPVAPTEEQMLAEIAAAQAGETKKKPKFDPNDPRMQVSYEFEFSWEDKHGKVWDGTFTSVIPSLHARASIGVMRAKLAGGMPFESLDPADLEVNFVLAHLSVFLKRGEKSRPKWAQDLYEVRDSALLMALWNQEVALHEATFFGRE